MQFPRLATVLCVILVLFLVLCSFSLVVAYVDGIDLNENQILYIFSTTSQVIAAVYGLTLTGFVFIKSELSREVALDDTLEEVVGGLEQRYFWLLIVISALVVADLLLAILAMSGERAFPVFETVVINVALSTFVTGILAIVWFVFEIVFPGRIALESRGLQQEVDPAGQVQAPGNLEQFLRVYNRIESFLRDAAGPYSAEEGSRHGPARMSNTRLAEMLYRNGRVNVQFRDRLLQLIRLRNAIVHGADPVVSSDIVLEAENLMRELEGLI